MSPDQIFQICNIIALIGWLIIILLPQWRQSDRFLLGIIITLLAIIYTWLIISAFKPVDAKSFSSLDGVMNLLLSQKQLAVAGWVHYLAFDLLAGLFIKKNSVKHGMKHLLIIPCFILTFVLGPMGLLLYLLTRLIITKRYFAENF